MIKAARRHTRFAAGRVTRRRTYHTQTSLRVTARILDKAYELGRACSKGFREIKDNFIRHDDFLWQWNYVVDGNGFFP